MAQKTIFELDLVNIAKGHRLCTWLVLAVFVTWLAMVLAAVNSIAIPEAISIVMTILYLGSLLAGVVFVIVLQRACGSGVLSLILYGILTVLFSFLMIFATISRAGTILRLAGAKPGFVGISKDEWDKLRPGHCRGCGYDRSGLELLQMCPECQRVPQVI